MIDFKKEAEIQFVIFKLGSEEYGIPITQVREINRLTAPTKIPKSPPFIEGVINLRGQIIPILDMKKRFDLELTQYTDSARIMVVEVRDQVFGIIVDAVSEVLRMATANIEPTPGMVASIGDQYIAGVGKVDERLLIILNLDKLLTEEEHQALGDISQMPEE